MPETVDVQDLDVAGQYEYAVMVVSHLETALVDASEELFRLATVVDELEAQVAAYEDMAEAEDES